MKQKIYIKNIELFLKSMQFENSLSSVNESFAFIKKLEKNPYLDISLEVQTRTSLQNRALHKLFSIIAELLNEAGMYFKRVGLNGKQIECPWNTILVKDFIWRELQKDICKKESTTDIESKEINQIFDVLCRHLGKIGIEIYFPSNDWESFNEWYETNRYK